MNLLKIYDNRIKLLNHIGIEAIKDFPLYFPYCLVAIETTSLRDQEKVMIGATLIDESKIFFKGRLSKLSFLAFYQG